MIRARSGSRQDHDRLQLSSRLRFGRFDARPSQAGFGQRNRARKFLPAFLVFAIIAAAGTRNLITRCSGAKESVESNTTADEHGKALVSERPQTGTGRQPGTLRLLLALIAIIIVAGIGLFTIR